MGRRRTINPEEAAIRKEEEELKVKSVQKEKPKIDSQGVILELEEKISPLIETGNYEKAHELLGEYAKNYYEDEEVMAKIVEKREVIDNASKDNYEKKESPIEPQGDVISDQETEKEKDEENDRIIKEKKIASDIEDQMESIKKKMEGLQDFARRFYFLSKYDLNSIDSNIRKDVKEKIQELKAQYREDAIKDIKQRILRERDIYWEEANVSGTRYLKLIKDTANNCRLFCEIDLADLYEGELKYIKERAVKANEEIDAAIAESVSNNNFPEVKKILDKFEEKYDFDQNALDYITKVKDEISKKFRIELDKFEKEYDKVKDEISEDNYEKKESPIEPQGDVLSDQEAEKEKDEEIEILTENNNNESTDSKHKIVELLSAEEIDALSKAIFEDEKEDSIPKEKKIASDIEDQMEKIKKEMEGLEDLASRFYFLSKYDLDSIDSNIRNDVKEKIQELKAQYREDAIKDTKQKILRERYMYWEEADEYGTVYLKLMEDVANSYRLNDEIGFTDLYEGELKYIKERAVKANEEIDAAIAESVSNNNFPEVKKILDKFEKKYDFEQKVIDYINKVRSAISETDKIENDKKNKEIPKDAETVPPEQEIFDERSLNNFSKKMGQLRDELAYIEAQKEVNSLINIDERSKEIIAAIELENERCEKYLFEELKKGSSFEDLKKQNSLNFEVLDLLKKMENRFSLMDPGKVKARFSEELKFLMDFKDENIYVLLGRREMGDKLRKMAEILGFNDKTAMEKGKFDDLFDCFKLTEVGKLEDKFEDLMKNAEKWTQRELYEKRIANESGRKKEGFGSGVLKLAGNYGKMIASFKVAALASSGIFSTSMGAALVGGNVATAGAIGSFLFTALAFTGLKEVEQLWEKKIENKKASKEKIDLKNEEHRKIFMDNLVNAIGLEQLDKLDPEKRDEEAKHLEKVCEYAASSKKDKAVELEEYLKKRSVKKFKENEGKIEGVPKNHLKAVLVLERMESRSEAQTAERIFDIAKKNPNKIKNFVKSGIGKKALAGVKTFLGEAVSLGLYEVPLVNIALNAVGGGTIGMEMADKLTAHQGEKVRAVAKTAGFILGGAVLSLAFAPRAEGHQFEGFSKEFKNRWGGLREKAGKEWDLAANLRKGKEGLKESKDIWWEGFKARHKVVGETEKYLEKKYHGEPTEAARDRKIDEKFLKEIGEIEKKFTKEELDAGAMEKLSSTIKSLDNKRGDLSIQDKINFLNADRQAKEDVIKALKKEFAPPITNQPAAPLPKQTPDLKIPQTPHFPEKSVFEVKKGENLSVVSDKVWNELRKEGIKMPEPPQGLTGEGLANWKKADAIYRNDAVKDALSKQVKNPNLIKPGELEVDMNAVRTHLEKHNIIKEAGNLSGKEVNNILENKARNERTILNNKKNGNVRNGDKEEVKIREGLNLTEPQQDIRAETVKNWEKSKSGRIKMINQINNENKLAQIDKMIKQDERFGLAKFLKLKDNEYEMFNEKNYYGLRTGIKTPDINDNYEFKFSPNGTLKEIKNGEMVWAVKAAERNTSNKNLEKNILANNFKLNQKSKTIDSSITPEKYFLHIQNNRIAELKGKMENVLGKNNKGLLDNPKNAKMAEIMLERKLDTSKLNKNTVECFSLCDEYDKIDLANFDMKKRISFAEAMIKQDKESGIKMIKEWFGIKIESDKKFSFSVKGKELRFEGVLIGDRLESIIFDKNGMRSGKGIFKIFNKTFIDSKKFIKHLDNSYKIDKRDEFKKDF
ncbi:MAG: hypothetical protein V1891_00920 [bacterium]